MPEADFIFFLPLRLPNNGEEIQALPEVLDPVRGNCRRKKRQLTVEEVKESLEPLPERKRRTQ